jgi:hypothetical protein
MEIDETTKIPSAIKNILNHGEQIIAVLTQSRITDVITPKSIVVTNHRIIQYSPSSLGLRKDVETYLYEDMANFSVHKGIMFATMTIGSKMMSDPLSITNLPKTNIDEITKSINEAIRRARTPTTTPPSVITNANEDPVKLLKVRFVKGEITKEQYDEMRKLIE